MPSDDRTESPRVAQGNGTARENAQHLANKRLWEENQQLRTTLYRELNRNREFIERMDDAGDALAKFLGIDYSRPTHGELAGDVPELVERIVSETTKLRLRLDRILALHDNYQADRENDYQRGVDDGYEAAAMIAEGRDDP